MFRYLITAGIFVLLAREVCLQISTDLATNTGTDPLVSTFAGTASAGGGGTTSQPGATSETSSASGNKQASTDGVSSGNPPPGATPKITASAAKDNSVFTTTTSSNFHCYQGNCTGTKCHKNESIYSSLNSVPCEEHKCAIKVTQNSNWSLTEFSCNVGQCICKKKVPGQEEMCCTSSECNNQKLECSHSSILGTSLLLLLIVFVNVYLLN